ncbi:MAG: hypothetical protein GX660_26920 [Clostridiaceae bacterium]|nr:hypothetical protein [Clostridiaceae bacterium]
MMSTTYSVVFALIILNVVIVLLLILKANPLDLFRYFYAWLTGRLAKINTKKTTERIKRKRIEKEKKGIISRYNNMVENLIEDYHLPLTLEGFNTVLTFLIIVAVIFIFIFVKNVLLSILVSISLTVAGFTYFITQARHGESAKIDAIMDVEDLLCPLAREGVLVAIKKVLESKEQISPMIRPYFMQFVDNCENHGYSFKRAMEVLNRQLGPKFDSFAEKAVVFEYNERKGMADIFLDIVDENAALREINARKNRLFREMNREFIIKTALIFIFVLYSLTNPDLRKFMLSTNLGRTINAMMIITVCLSFARCQMLQRDITIKKGDS